MASDSAGNGETPDAAEAAAEIAGRLAEQGVEYAVGGALALGCWTGRPRGTIDADINLFIPPNDTAGCLTLLTAIGCRFDRPAAEKTLNSHGFCRVTFRGRQVDFFLPLTEFHDEARRRRVAIDLHQTKVDVLDAESICVFKVMFFRLQDLADVEALLRARGDELDCRWIETQVEQLFGPSDPRLTRWRELVAATEA